LPSWGISVVVDFSKLSRPKSVAAPVDPLEIFKKTPNLGNAPNDLWKGQAEALASWNENRKRNDNVVILNTGAGKSIVGILIAQSLHNEGTGPVVYACSTIDLVRQTERECARLGIQCTVRAGGSFSNDLYETGRAFCITTYAALFAPITTFTKEKTPASVVFDDAHVGERLIRDAFTLSIAKNDHPELFADLLSIVRPEFDAIGKGPHLSFILEDVGQSKTTLCPPATAFRHRAEIVESLKKHSYKDHEALFFPTVQLYEHFGYCAIFVSSSSIEIAPPFIPTQRFAFLGGGVRRVYLSATLDYPTDFIRGFGVANANRIEPDNDAGNGERLILLGTQFARPLGQKDLAATLAKERKVLVAVPSYARAKDWGPIVVPPDPKAFSSELDAFRSAKSGLFCLVSRVDGIDLPQDTCRIMIVDGAPTGSSLLERYQFEALGMANLFSTKLAGRITQLFGRINRGRSDYGAFLIYGADISGWLRNERNIALLPTLLRKQVILGQSLQKDMPVMSQEQAIEVVSGTLERDPGWLNFYRDTIDGLEVSEDAIARVKEREEKLAAGAVAECQFMSKLWEGDVAAARLALLDAINDVAIADAKLAGWYSMWVGMTYEIEGDLDASGMHYARARSRLSRFVNLPHRTQFSQEGQTTESKSPTHGRLLAINEKGPQALGHFVDNLRNLAAEVTTATKTFSQHEEAVRSIGEALGYDTARPDNELSVGPDVVWVDEDAKCLIAFELKTKKDSPAQYVKDEVGQYLNHLEWLTANYSGYRFDGLIVIGPAGTCSTNASPGDRVFLLTPQRFEELIRSFAAKVDDVRGAVALERWTAVNEIGQLTEWQLTGWFTRFAEQLLEQLKPN
jgi:hypothetical protein